MKRILIITAIALVAVITAAAGFGAYNAYAAQQQQIFYGLESGAPTPWGGRGMDMGNMGRMGQNMASQLAAIPAADLSAEEQAAILFMVQEEQLARDVYDALYTQTGLQVFDRISQSEQMHMDAVKQLISRYNLADPSLEAGKYADPALQALYDQLIAQAKGSLADALLVGGLIEETDIADLRKQMEGADNADLQMVFNNLQMASYNHLRAFAGNYTQQSGTTYQAQVLDQAEVDQLLAQPMGRGNHGGTMQPNGQLCTQPNCAMPNMPNCGNPGGRWGGKR